MTALAVSDWLPVALLMLLARDVGPYLFAGWLIARALSR